MPSSNIDVPETDKKNLVKEKSEKMKNEKNDVFTTAVSREKSIKEEKPKTAKSVSLKKKKTKEKSSNGEVINKIQVAEFKDAVQVKSIINSDELFVDNRQCETENDLNETIAKDNVNEHIHNNSLEAPAENTTNKTASYNHDEKSTEVQKTTKISNNGELVVEPVKFKDKLNMWKGTINSIKIRKEDEQKLQEKRLKQLENVKLAQNLKKEEELLQREYLEQLKKDEELAKKIEQELNEEIKNELHQIEENDFKLAQRLQSDQGIQDKNSTKKIGSFKKMCSKASSHNNIKVDSNNDLFVGDQPSKAQQLKQKFRNLFKKKKKSPSRNM